MAVALVSRPGDGAAGLGSVLLPRTAAEAVIKLCYPPRVSERRSLQPTAASAGASYCAGVTSGGEGRLQLQRREGESYHQLHFLPTLPLSSSTPRARACSPLQRLQVLPQLWPLALGCERRGSRPHQRIPSARALGSPCIEQSGGAGRAAPCLLGWTAVASSPVQAL